MLIAGIDEAGYGPILGPLVISSTAFRLPSSLSKLPMWELLTGSVTSKPSRAATRLVIADSKKVYRKRGDLGSLERSALAAIWTACKTRPADLTDLLGAVSLEADPHLRHKWYCHQEFRVPQVADAAELRIATKLFARELAEIDGELAAVKTIPLVESRFNELVDRMRNKSAVLFAQTVRLIDGIIRGTAERQIEIYIDKQGGKNHYHADLLRCFGSAIELEVLRESDECSDYRLKIASKTVGIHFVVKGDVSHLPIALASIVSKYVRELFMLQFNRYWQQFRPDLKPTAGYWTDGKRFLADIADILAEQGSARDQLVRQR